MPTKKYKLGFAFGGGGAKAAAHCGALQAMKEYGLEPDIVSGTSAGALVATLYSVGYTPVQMVELFEGLNFFKDIVTPAVPKGGFFDSKPLVEYIRKLVPYSKIEDLPIPTNIVASDMEHGIAKVFAKGEIASRVVASCSIPVIFRPMLINGVHYIDGGTLQNLPVPAIRQKCEKVIAFNLINLIDEEKYKDNIISVAYRSFSMMFMSNIITDAKQADLFVELDTKGCSFFDMSKLEELFFRGYQNTINTLETNGYTRLHEPEKIVFKKSNKSKSAKMKRDHSVRDTIKERVGTISGNMLKKE